MSDQKTEAETKAAEAAAETIASADEVDAATVTLESFDGVADEAEGIADPKDQEIERLQAEIDEIKDKLIRAAADVQNTRKRAERDRREAEQFGGVKLARDVLGVYDNLTKALSLVTDDLRSKEAAFVEGIELTQRELVQSFAKHKIEHVAPAKGEKFDPHLHQAMFEAPFGEPGTVVEVIQEGFTLSERLLRPALVGVASASAQPMPVEDEAEAVEGEDGRAS